MEKIKGGDIMGNIKPVFWIDGDNFNTIFVIMSNGDIVLRGKTIGKDKELADIFSRQKSN